jgi:hypothetical protein
MNPSIVAMFGRIMPAPLEMPVTRTSAPAIVARRDTALATVSVVMMASAASSPVPGIEVGDRFRQTGHQTIHGQRLEDHSGRERQHLARVTSQQPREFDAAGTRILEPGSAGARIRAPGVDQKRADACTASVVGQVLAAHLDRRGAEPVAREHTRDRGTRREPDHQHVATARLADSGARAAEIDTGDGEQLRRIRRRKIHGHGGQS